MRAATEAAWLQVKAPREHLDVCKTLRQFVVILLCYITVCNSKRAFASHAAILQHTNNGAHFLFPLKWAQYCKKYLVEEDPWLKVILTPRACAKANAARRT